MSEHEQRHETRIHIDQRQFESPSPTTGEALYNLGEVVAGMILYREVSGDEEDVAIGRGSEAVHLRQDEHFHSGPPQKVEVRIFVNGRPREVSTKELSFDQVVALAFNPVPTGPNIMFTITYRHGPHANPAGNLLEGRTVKIKNGMVFDVTATDKS